MNLFFLQWDSLDMKSGKALCTKVWGVFLLKFVRIWNIIEVGSDVRRGRKMKDTIKSAIITGGLGIISSIISFSAGGEKVEQRIENQVSQVLKIDDEGTESSVEYLISRVKELEDENENLAQQLEETKTSMMESTGIVQNENSENNANGEYVSLLSVAKVVDPCRGFEIRQTDTMSLRGDNYTNGFILHYYYNTEGVEFKLGSEYSKMKFKIGH